MISSRAYSEIYEILKYMDKDVVMKIPLEILENINNKRDKIYKTQIKKEDIFNPNNVLPETIKVLNWIDINFWMSKEKKEKVLKKLKKQELEKEKYNYDNLFKKNTNIETTSKDMSEKNNALKKHKTSFFTKFKNIIFKILSNNK